MTDFFIPILQNLREIFGENCRIYTDKLNSDLQMPAFVLSPIISEEKLFLNNRYLSENKISIRFYCENKDKSQLYPQICNKISESFQTLTINSDLYRCSNIKFIIRQDYLEINLSYDYFFFKTEINEKMQYLKIKKG